jgi:hypothetical protein
MKLIFSFLSVLLQSFIGLSQLENATFDKGLPPSQMTCEIYLKHEDWLPDAFITNAVCACLKIPDEEGANIIRQVLIQRLDSVNSMTKAESILMKRSFAKKEISKYEYNKYVKSVLTPIIHRDHVIAYDLAGCEADPAPYFGWKQITTREVKNCSLIWFSIRYFGGSCSGKWGRW